ncbi:MAG: hypothetical protein U0V72_04160 [Cytophagales bacterium]
MKKLLCFLSCVVFLWSCKNEQKQEVVDDVKTDHIKVEVDIKRLERELFQHKDLEHIKKFVDENPKVAEVFFQMPVAGEEDKQRLAQKIVQLVNHPSLDSIYQASEKVYGNMDDVKAQFEEGYKHIKYYYPQFKVPKIQTIITGFTNDKLITDTCITLGLDYFLGTNIKYAPPVFEYVRQRLTKPYFVHNIMLETSSKFVEIDPNDETLLASMVAWGKVLYFTHKVMPSLPDSVICGYTNKQMEGAQKHEALIFNYFIKNNLLYSASHTNEKFVSERPYTAEIGAECPPRIGRWLGYLIVKKYMENNPKLTLPDVMKEKDAKKIFTQSKYKPRK